MRWLSHLREYVNPVFKMSINYFPGVLKNFIGLELSILGLWELGKDFWLLRATVSSISSPQVLSKGRAMASSSRWESSCREMQGKWQPSSRWKSLGKKFCTVQAIVVGHSQMRKANNILACIKPHTFLLVCLHCLFVEQFLYNLMSLNIFIACFEVLLSGGESNHQKAVLILC